jgi:hypothetical protein
MERNDNDDNKKILLNPWVVKEIIAFASNLFFQAQSDDLRFKCCILGRNTKPNISGSTPHSKKTHSSGTRKWGLKSAYHAFPPGKGIGEQYLGA